MKLFNGVRNNNETFEKAALRIVEDEHYGLPPMSIHLGMRAVEGVVGYALRPVGEYDISPHLRSFTVWRHEILDIKKRIHTRPEYFDPIDLNFIKQYLEHPRLGLEQPLEK